MPEINVKIRNDEEAKLLFGKFDNNLKKIETMFDAVTSFREGTLKVTSSDEVSLNKVSKMLEEILKIIRKGGTLSARDMKYAIKNADEADFLEDIFMDKIEVNSKQSYITAKSRGQKEYINSIKNHDIVFCIGPAGTGKTYIAMAMAVNALKKNLVSRIILTRPAVEAGENLGFLPGDLYEKVNPYLRPLYDALYDMVEPHMVKEYLSEGIIEVAPLAYMRGRTLNDSFIIMDEAQNSTQEQMKMFLTRMGFGSKTVITGDVTQSDLPKGKKSGLLHAEYVLEGTNGIKFVNLKGEDVVRHELVQEIIKAYKRKAESGNE